eukprot:g24038.t1
MPRALVCAQAFPPLLKQAGGVAKDYLALCRALIDGLGWEVTLLTPVNIQESGEDDVARWLLNGQLVYAPVGAVEASSNIGVAAFMDFFSITNTVIFLRLLAGKRGHDVCFLDDSCLRIAPIMLLRSFGIPSIATTHSDVPSHPMYQESMLMKILWWLHLASAFFATVHATVASVYANDADYADEIEASVRRNVLPQRGMLGAEDLRIAYAASDLYVSASTCETLGNTVVEAWSSGTPVAIQPVGGHLEFVKDEENSYLVDFDNSQRAREHLSRIVAGGTKAAVEPCLSKMGEHFRQLNFSGEIQRLLLDPVLATAATWRARSVLEILLRGILFLACCVVWPATMVWSRVYFAMSCDPKYRHVAPGSANEPDFESKPSGVNFWAAEDPTRSRNPAAQLQLLTMKAQGRLFKVTTQTSNSALCCQALEDARDARAKAFALGAVARAQLLGRELLKAVEAAQQAVEAAKGADQPAQAMSQRNAAKA